MVPPQRLHLQHSRGLCTAACLPLVTRAVPVLLQSRELNPHFANGGDGVPPPKPAGSAVAAAAPRPAGVGDGGTSWRLKALRRAQATAAEEGKDVREVRSVDCLQGARGSGLGPEDWQCTRGTAQSCRLHEASAGGSAAAPMPAPPLCCCPNGAPKRVPVRSTT